MKEYEVRYLDLENGERMAYRECGSPENPPLILIHGNQSSSVFFQDTMAALEGEAHVLALDLIGFGDSSYNRQLDTLQDFSQDIALFMKQKGIENAVILGWSTGGGIILELAADHPELAGRLILLDSVGTQGYPLYQVDADNKPVLSQRISKREDVEKEPLQVVPVQKALEAGDKAFIKSAFDLLLYNLNPLDPEDYDKCLDAILKERCILDVDTALACFNMSNEYNGTVEGSGRLDLIQCPVTVLHGQKDLIVPVTEAEKTAVRLNGLADMVLLENAGHALLTDRPKAFVNVLRTALAEL